MSEIRITPDLAMMERALKAMQEDECNCEFDVDPDDPEDDWHYRRTCTSCGKQWWSLHCPHDGYQNPCPACKTRNRIGGLNE